MKFQSEQLLYYILTLLIGIFLRDIYNWIKSKVLKGEKPQVSINFSLKWRSTTGMNPRNYKFIYQLIVKNIDVLPIYDINVYKKLEREKTELIKQESLPPNEQIVYNDEIFVEYGDSGNKFDEAKQKIPFELRNPTIIVEFKNKKGKKFTIKKTFKEV